MTIKDFKVGQTAYIVGSRDRRDSNDLSEATVAKIGRKYVTIKGGWNPQFKEMDEDKPYLVEDAEYGCRRMLFPTQQAAQDYIETHQLRDWIRKKFDRTVMDRYTLAQLREVKKILEGDDHE